MRQPRCLRCLIQSAVLAVVKLTDNIQDCLIPSRRPRSIARNDCSTLSRILLRTSLRLFRRTADRARFGQENGVIQRPQRGQVLSAAPNSDQLQLDVSRFPEQL